MCGTRKYVRKAYLVKGTSKSCGCKKAEMVSKAMTKHGHSGQYHKASRTYVTWRAMQVRCDNPLHHAYHNYGGRGISICPQWREFGQFLKDMGERPKGFEIDRIDNDGNYQPDNCRWVPRPKNVQNCRHSKRWVVDGREFPSARVAAKELGVGVLTIRRWCNGWTDPRNGKYSPPKKNCYSELIYQKD